MGIHVDRSFICSLIKQFYIEKQNHDNSCIYYVCKRLVSLLNEMERLIFYDLNQFHDKCFIIFHRKYDSEITLCLVFIWKNVSIHNS